VLVSIHTGHLLDGAGVEVPDVEVAAAGGEEDAGVGRVGVEGRGREGRVLDVQGEEERVWGGGVRVDAAEAEGAAGAGGEEERERRVEG